MTAPASAQEDLAAQLTEAKNKIQEQEDRIDELEDSLQALLCCFHDLSAQMDRMRGGHNTRLGSVSSTLDDESDEVAVPVYGSCFGYLNKVSGGIGSKGSKKRWCILHDDGNLYYWKTMKASTVASAEKGVIDIRGYEVVATAPPKTGFKLMGEGKRNFEFLSDSVAERQRWIVALTTVQQKLDQLRLSSSADSFAERKMTIRKMNCSIRSGRTAPAPPANEELLKRAQHHDHVTWVDNTHTQWSRNFLVLADDKLHFYNQRNTTAESFTLDLSLCPVGPTISMEGDLFTIKISFRDSSEFVRLGFSSEKQCNAWASAISAACDSSCT